MASVKVKPEFGADVEMSEQVQLIERDSIPPEMRVTQADLRPSIFEDNEELEVAASASEIADAHLNFRLEDNQFSSSKQMLDSVMYQVPINKLYKVIASCNFNPKNYHCPVLVKILDEHILA